MKPEKALRRFALGMSTLLGTGPGGVFVPYRHAAGLRPPARGYLAIEAFLDAMRPAFTELLGEIGRHGARLAEFDGAMPPLPRWQQGWFPRLDAAAAYALVRRRRPARIVEVGSGHSTRFLVRAVIDGGLDCAVDCIDPAPRADLAGLPVRLQRCTLQQADTGIIAGLGADDILFIDSSHLALPGSDVDHLVSEWLPRLPTGTLVHFHDILLPDDYPAGWRWRAYNEQQVVAALLAGGGFRPLFASHYVATRMASEVAASAADALPNPFEAPETSLWLEKTSPPLV